MKTVPREAPRDKYQLDRRTEGKVGSFEVIYGRKELESRNRLDGWAVPSKAVDVFYDFIKKGWD